MDISRRASVGLETWRRRPGRATTLGLAALVFVACGPPGNIADPPKPIRITSVSLDDAHPTEDKKLTLSWDIDTGDTSLVRQTVVTRAASMIGFLCTDSIDTDAGLPPGAPDSLLLIDRAAFLFFVAGSGGTVTLTVFGADGSTDSVTFDLVPNDGTELDVDVLDVQDTSYPRLGFGMQKGKTYRFSEFTAFFDPPTRQNALIDVLPAFLMPDARSFRMRSFSRREDEGFGAASGRSYVRDCITVAEAAPTANAYIYGQAVSYSGEPTTVKDESGKGDLPAARGVLTFEPIFIAIPLRVNFAATPPSVSVLDVVLGNSDQGLACAAGCSVQTVGDDRRQLGPRTIAVTGTTGATAGTLSGTIGLSVLGADVITLGGTQFGAFVTISEIRLRMPFELDDSMGPRLTVGSLDCE